ncbi:hypothetical protein CH333_08960 [candidate division WOR-3 bacterium JGI_Cruoil_03_44_89]|uniref:TonB-dependent receptor plug domain-containing protein n=1 Tax=candidate division WOR-3 bacterium JGI_Cruoil_03_44_89 TaxID=1973748 RepID=A0A235BNQ0_UNCW3|nr:MAG: hypothetical protein CH333_08960 [candidate division WOR-3 bacterium JGI_Cruoil_03_44_89]
MKRVSFLMIALIFPVIAFAGVTGKIAGIVTNAETGETLPGANVIIEGTTMGAATNLEGYYVILNVSPGTYRLRASMMGYATSTVTEVRVMIDLTTVIDFKMKPTVLSGEEVVVTAERPIIQKDVAGTQRSVTSNQIEALPAASISEVVGLQVGITSGLSIRGSGSDQVIFMVDGIVLRDKRTNQPISQVPLSAVEEISVQAGGFGPEYHNVRSGVVNVVTKEGNPNRYGGTITFKMRPPDAKHFGLSPYDPNSFWLRPFLDPDVCWTGTKSGTWDKYTQRQYPEFEGWLAFSERTLSDNDPTNDLTPEAAQRVFMWQYRKQGEIKKPDYNVDFGFGGPVPFFGKSLGNLRFYTSFRYEQDMYLVELSRDALTDYTWMNRFTSDITPSLKLSVLGLYGETHATALSRVGRTSYMSSAWDIADATDRIGFTLPWRLYTNDYWCPTSRFYHTISARLTHMLNPNTFYEVQLKEDSKRYDTGPGLYRDTTKRYEIFEGYFLDEAPFGFQEEYSTSIEGNLAMGGPISTSRDSSKYTTVTAKFDFVSQINPSNQIKTGLEFVYDDYDMWFGSWNAYLPEGNHWSIFERNPFRLTTYLQDKLEFEGFISILGLIAEYADPNGDWYDVGYFDKSLYSQDYKPEDEPNINKKKAEAHLTFSPRLAVSHPITENSKLYFNYGHYREMPTSEALYRVHREYNYKADYVGDPTIPLAKTVSYELGYDHALFDEYLLRLSAYYKDVSNQQDWTRYMSADGKVNYYRLTNKSYEDIRGFEIDFTKMIGRWVTGNANYEYRVGTSGYFGVKQYYENPAEQREYERKNPAQYKPRPRPRFKSQVDFHTPIDFGTEFVGQRPFGNWHFNFISSWTAGSWFTWNPNNVPGIGYNVQRKDFYNVDLKVSKTFPLGNFDVRFFADVFNLFNTKHFSWVSFYDGYDYDYYMKSLHLPASIAEELGYGNIPGDDRPGNCRDEGVEYQPMEWVPDVSILTEPNPEAIYYDANTERYMQWVEDEWVEVDKDRTQEVLDTKAYIDMPNQTYFTFLNPRSIFFGLTINYHF